MLDERGNIYGTTSSYGLYGAGTAFLLKPPLLSGSSWTYVVLHAFQRSPDGSVPTGALLFGGQGTVLYGLTGDGGTGANCFYGGCGTVYEITPL